MHQFRMQHPRNSIQWRQTSRGRSISRNHCFKSVQRSGSDSWSSPNNGAGYLTKDLDQLLIKSGNAATHNAIGSAGALCCNPAFRPPKQRFSVRYLRGLVQMCDFQVVISHNESSAGYRLQGHLSISRSCKSKQSFDWARNRYRYQNDRGRLESIPRQIHYGL